MYLKAALTVEASLVMGICIMLVTAAILLSFDMYHETVEYIDEIKVEDFDIVSKFRLYQMGREIVDSILQN